MKRVAPVLALIVVLLFAVSLAGCGGSAKEEPAPNASGQPATTPELKYPEKAITLIIATNPGGGVDTACRGIMPYVQKELGQTVMIENRPGNNSLIGINYFYENAKPDGYTLLAANNGNSLNPLIYKDAYKPKEDYPNAFEFIYAFATGDGNGIIVKKDSPFNSMDDLVAEAKKRPLTAAIGSGMASTDQITVIAIQKFMGGEYRLIPVNGSAEAIALVLGGKVDFGIGSPNVPAANPEQVRMLAVTMEDRSEKWPNTPTFQELGKPEGTVMLVIGVVAPKGTPPEIVKKLEDAFAKARQNPEYLAWAKQATQPIGSSGWSGQKFQEYCANYVKNMQDMIPIMEQQLKDAQK